MSSLDTQPESVTTRRTRPTVAVTGAASGVGQLLATSLTQSPDVRKVIAVDERRGEIPGVTWRVLDIRDPVMVDRLSDVDVVVHLAVDTDLDADPRGRSARNVRGTQTVLTAAAAANVSRVVLCTSAMVYGALPDNPVPLPDDAPLRAVPDGALLGDLLEIERLAERTPRSHPGVHVTVVRPAALVGPGIDTVLTRHFEAPRLLVVKGSEPCWQFCHVDDLVSALEHAVLGRVEGAVTVGSDGWLDQEDVELITGMRRIELPEAVATGAAERLHRLRLTPVTAGELQFVMHPWAVSSAKLRAAGWQPAYDNEQALTALMDEVTGHHAALARRLGRKDAATTLGAAGATVALVGTAALVRRARRKRRGEA